MLTTLVLATGENYSINYPLNDWIDDASFVSIFKTVVGEIMTKFAPGAVVLQCGADSLAGDRLGLFNLTLRGHADCVNFVKSFKVPLMILGGGGYTMRNVARLWTYETSVLLETDISNNLPANKYFEYFGPSYKLHIDPLSSPQHKNENTDEYVRRSPQKSWKYFVKWSLVLAFKSILDSQDGRGLVKTQILHVVTLIRLKKVT